MATHYYGWGELGVTIGGQLTNPDGTHPDLSAATLLVEACRIGNPSAQVMSATPTGDASGNISLTVNSTVRDQLDNRTENYWLAWWATVGGVTRRYPNDGWDVLSVTEDSAGQPSSSPGVSYYTEAEVDGLLAGYVTLATAQTITGQKTIAIDGNAKFLKLDATAADRSVLAVYRNNPPAGDEWATGTIINSQGAYASNAWMILSGVMPATPDSDGLYFPRAASSTLASPLSSMLSIWSDLGAGHPALEVRAAPIGSPGYLAQFFDRDCKFVFSIEETGELQWGAGATHAANDVRLYRDAATSLRTNAALRVDGILTASQHDSVSGAAMTLRSRRTADSGDYGFTLLRENQSDDPLLKIVNGSVDTARLSAYGSLDVLQGQSFNWAWKVGTIAGSESYPGLWFGPNVPSLSNYSFLYDAGTSIVNGPSAVAIRVNNANQIRVGSGTLGFYGTAPIAKQTGVAVSAAGIHAALVALGLIAA